MNSRALRTILTAGLIAGIIDITYACIFNYMRRGMTPKAVFQSVAGGALGSADATAGGWKTAALGLGFHFLIALTWAAIFYAASRQIRFMVTQPVISGLVYGLIIYLVMYGIVLRYSAYHVRTYPWAYPWTPLIGNVGRHMLGIGPSIALVTRKRPK